jgi:Xaa-Pro aminopeptidase
MLPLMEHFAAPLLLYGNTKSDADVRYLLGAQVHDDLAVVFDGKSTVALVSALEINRLRRESKIDNFVNWNELAEESGATNGCEFAILRLFLEKIGLNHLTVKQNFPVHFADGLRASGVDLSICDFRMLPQRMVKSEGEIIEIRRAISMAGKTLAKIEITLADSAVNGNGELVFDGEILTAERLRGIAEETCFILGAIGEDSIISCGSDSCDPHAIGSGPLRAHELILVDFFPYLKSSGYYADLSRTFIKGKPSAEQMRLYETVKCAHDSAIDALRDGIPACDLMENVLRYFDGRGYKSSKTSKPPRGMFHSLGHGFGLSIHEPPRIGSCGDILRSGMVVTIEPGLYYEKIGGVRLEDDLLIGKNSCELLSCDIPHNFSID